VRFHSTIANSVALVAWAWAAQAMAAPVLEGVPPRALTDPESITSPVLAGSAPVPIDDLFYTRSGAFAVWVPHTNTIVVSTNLTGRFNLWSVPADGGFPLQLTQSDDRQYGRTASPDGKWIVFQSDRAGAEVFDLYAVPAMGGAVTDLTNTPNVDEQGAMFSPDGTTLAFVCRAKTAPSANVAVMNFATHEVRELTQEKLTDHGWSTVAFSHDGKLLLANRKNATLTESEIWLIDVASSKATLLTKPGEFNEATDISPDGRTIALTTETRTGNKQSALLDVRSNSVRLLKPDVWEQSAGGFSPDGRTLLFASDVDGRTALEKFDVGSGAIAPLNLPEGVNRFASNPGSSFSPDGGRILVTHQASNTPFDYWIVDATTGAARQLTRLGLASINPEHVPAAKIIHYKSADGTVISAFLWVPFNLARGGEAPGVVLPHGGPAAQTTDTFNRDAIALASRGFVVIAPNVRGSTGYGRAFKEANRKDLGGGDLRDEIAAAEFMVSTGYVNAKKIGITGNSYGGYMTLMAIAKTPAYWAAGVEEFGIIDWQTMLLHETPALQQYEKGILGDPVRDKAIYTTTSPLTYMHDATAPLLVLQGDNDVRVPKDQAEKVVEIMKANGRTVDAHYYAGEGHGFYKRENQIDALERLVAWMEKYLN
jgi:dipeptidyl aminopeptidase/acylaminoacyl peptidase